jgi:hypothetical protein
MRCFVDALNQLRARFKSWFEHRPVRSFGILAAVLALVIYPAVSAIYQGVVANVFFVHFWPWILARGMVPHWIVVVGWGLFFIAATGLVILMSTIVKQSEHIQRQAELSHRELSTTTQVRLDKLNADLRSLNVDRDLHVQYFDISLELLMMAALMGPELTKDASAIDVTFKKMAQSVMGHAARMYGGVTRTSLFLPSATNPHYLTVFASNGLDEESIRAACWYVGPKVAARRTSGRGRRPDSLYSASVAPDELQQGTAGKAFLTRTTLVRHINPKTFRAEEGSDYVRSSADRHFCPYASLLAVPIVDGNRAIGVFCLDSQTSDVFDHDKNHTAVKPAAKLLAHLIGLRQHLIEVFEERKGVAI